MRIGTNPGKFISTLHSYPMHRVIIPVYIPKIDGYFSNLISVVRICLRTLNSSDNSNTAITVISNGCCDTALSALLDMRACGWIDQLIVNERNRGKVDSVLSVARGCFEEFVTISDADVYFYDHWFDDVLEIFQAFEYCGVVCPFPTPNLAFRNTSSTLLHGVLTGKARYKDLVNKEELQRFAESVGTPDLFSRSIQGPQLTLQSGDTFALVGAGHFIATYRRGVIRCLPDVPSLSALSSEADEQYLEVPVDQAGYLRLSCPRAGVFHIGNQVEPWMEGEWVEGGNKKQVGILQELPSVKKSLSSFVPYGFRKFLARILRKALLRKSAAR